MRNWISKKKDAGIRVSAAHLSAVVASRTLPASFKRGRSSVRQENEQVSEVDIAPNLETSRRIPWHAATFVALAVIPFLISAFYYAFVGSDQYTAEARFAVRSIVDPSQGNELQGSGLDMRAASQDSYVITSFIHSTEILNRISKEIDIRSLFIREGVDYISAFKKDGSVEDLLAYWKKQVTTYIDGPSGIVTLKVRTFSPDDSLRLANLVISEGEKLINELSERARKDVLKSAYDEVEKSAKVYGTTLANLNHFQRESGLLSPEAQAQQTGKLLTGLISKKLELETRQFVMKQSSAVDAPAYEQLALARESLDGQIEELKGQLTGTEHESIAKALLRFSELETDRLVAEKLYEVARRTYSAALAESMRKALYLVVFVKPSLPESSLYPRRIFTPFLTFIALSILWATLALSWASIQDHRL